MQIPEERQLPLNRHVGVRVLCMDGGGSRGVAMALMVEKLEENLNDERWHGGKAPEKEVKLGQLFDLLAGTSTGGILAAALGLENMSGTRCKGLYEELTSAVFGKSTWYYPTYFMKGHRYNATQLQNLLKQYFKKDANLESFTTTPVVAMTSLDQVANKTVMFSTIDNPVSEDKLNHTRLVDALRATSAAPTYFREAFLHNRYFVDGGLGANCPARKALQLVNEYWNAGIEMGNPNPTKKNPEKPRTCELLVSLGTGIKEGFQAKHSGSLFGTLFNWGYKLEEVVTHSQRIYDESVRDLKHLNMFAYCERLNPENMDNFDLDCTEIHEIMKETEAWLAKNDTKEQLTRTTHKLIAKNYFVDVDTNYPKDQAKRNDVIHEIMANDGYLVCRIEQRKPLFKINKSAFSVSYKAPQGVVVETKIESDERGPVLKVKLNKEASKPVTEAKVKIVVWFTPTPEVSDENQETRADETDHADHEEGETRFLILGSPFIVTLYNTKKIGDNLSRFLEKFRKPTVPSSAGVVHIRTIGTVGDADDKDKEEELTDDMLVKFTSETKSHEDLQILGILGLQKDEGALNRHLQENPGDIQGAAVGLLREWRDEKVGKEAAYQTLIKVLGRK